MSVFEPVRFKYQGRDILVPANRVMGAVHVVEEVLTLKELAEMNASRNPKLGKISEAYAALIRYAGETDVTSEQVYETLFDIGGQEEATVAIQALLLMMVPKKVSSNKADTPKGNVETAASS